LVHWGYSWDCTGIWLNDQLEILSSVDHEIKRDTEITIPKNQKLMPAIFFKGEPSKNSWLPEIKNWQWLSLKELIEKVKR